jgi:hypothetical protein
MSKIIQLCFLSYVEIGEKYTHTKKNPTGKYTRGMGMGTKGRRKIGTGKQYGWS